MLLEAAGTGCGAPGGVGGDVADLEGLGPQGCGTVLEGLGPQGCDERGGAGTRGRVAMAQGTDFSRRRHCWTRCTQVARGFGAGE